MVLDMNDGWRLGLVERSVLDAMDELDSAAQRSALSRLAR